MASLKPKHPVAALYSEALRALRDRHREEFDEIYKAVKTGTFEGGADLRKYRQRYL